jgi:hypothetical protein
MTGVGAIAARIGWLVRLYRDEGLSLQRRSDLEVRGRLCDPLSFPRPVCSLLIEPEHKFVDRYFQA